MRDWREQQSRLHGPDHDYKSGSPHLKHPGLFAALCQLIQSALPTTEHPSVLDVGAGHGSFTGPLLDHGCRVTALEMSVASYEHLVKAFGHSPNFSAVYDHDGSLRVLGEQRFDLILYASVLHHIPDYRAAIRAAVAEHLAPGGALVTVQDPLFYPDLRFGVRVLQEVAYAFWRVTQGNYRRGFAARLRRISGRYDQAQPSDMVEYHVVRLGVDSKQIRRDLLPDFKVVEVHRYWSTQSSAWQRIGERLNVVNTFGLVAQGHGRTK